jgi:hypothetical protein
MYNYFILKFLQRKKNIKIPVYAFLYLKNAPSFPIEMVFFVLFYIVSICIFASVYD